MGFFSSLIGTVGDIGGSFIGDPGLGDQINMGTNALGISNNAPTNPGADIGGLFGGNSSGSSSSGGGIGGLFSSGQSLTGAAGIAGNALAVGSQQRAGQAANTQLNPFYQTGVSANSQIQNLLANPDSIDFSKLPGYQFNLSQGENAINNLGAAEGLSSGTLKGAGTFAEGLADSNFQNYFNRLMQLANMGVDTGKAMGQNTIGIGNAQAAGFNAAAKNAGTIFQSPAAGAFANQLYQGMYNKNQGNNSTNGFNGSTNNLNIGNSGSVDLSSTGSTPNIPGINSNSSIWNLNPNQFANA